ncbi:MAG: hypothetical protein M1834_000188 [Cirrosporium novae-zelandiae]|nr:MAG: hypothetical protein M1834_000188 [Cirrosporium novae-zelandiae]
MLDWLVGANDPPQAVPDQSVFDEPPETPAPLFAYKAFKSAIFGEPDPFDANNPIRPNAEVTHSIYDNAAKSVKDSRNGGGKAVQLPETKEVEFPAPIESASGGPIKTQPPSPTKGILLTPGTVGRRKTVSFGTNVLDNEKKKEARLSMSGLPVSYPGKFPSPWTPGQPTSTTQEDSTSRLLFTNGGSKRQDSPEKQWLELGACATVDGELKRPTNKPGPSVEEDDWGAADMTINLDEPHSRSGKYWKMEYESYQGKTSKEMQKLLKYKRLATSYAKKKDDEALKIAQLLKRERAKVAQMEDNISKLAAEFANVHVGSGTSDSAPATMMKVLAEQTTSALHYKRKVDRLQEELEQNIVQLDDNCLADEIDQIPDGVPVVSANTNTHISERSDFTAQLTALKEAAASAESKASKLEKENQELKHTITRVKTEMTRYEQRNQAREDKFRQREKDLKAQEEEVKAQLLELRKLQEELTRGRSEQFRVSSYNKIAEDPVAEMEDRIPQEGSRLSPTKDVTTPRFSTHDIPSDPKPNFGASARPVSMRSASLERWDHSDGFVSDIWTSDEVISKPAGVSVQPKRRLRRRSHVSSDIHTALAEIDPNDQGQASAQEGSGAGSRRNSLHMGENRVGGSRMESLDVSTLSGVQNIDHHPVKNVFSPRPSMFSFDPETPKRRAPGLTRRQASTSLSQAGRDNGGRHHSTLPPDRLAAAKARLEQKRREKKGAASSSQDSN